METVHSRIRRRLRSLARRPGFALVAIVTLGLGIGANSAIFSVVNGVLLRPLPFPGSERLVDVGHTAPGIDLDRFDLSDATYLHYRAQSRVFEELALHLERAVNLTGEGGPEHLPAVAVTASLQPVLGVGPLQGRFFTASDEAPGAEAVVVLSHGLWSRKYGADPAVVGRIVEVDGVGRRVVGVMPPGFSFPEPETELFLPLVLDPADLAEGSFDYRGVGRLRPGVTATAAAADLVRALETFPEAYPGDLTADFLDKARLAAVVTPLKERIVGDVERALWVLLASVAVILLVACANVANLFLVRAEGRQRELAVRAALGAGRRELAAELLSESLLLALAGGAVGLLLALVGVEVLTTVGPDSLPRLQEVSLDGRVVVFTLALSLLAGLLFGLAPMLRSSAPRLVAALKDGGRGATAGARRHLARHALVVVQVALALVLLVASGLLVRSVTALTQVEPGFDPEGVLTLRLSLPEARYPGPADAARFYDALLERVRSLPGVTAAGAVRYLPLGGSRSAQGVAVEDFPRPPDELPFLFPYTFASPGYFEALGIPLLAGRTFERADHQQPSGAVLISATLAQRLWPGQSALGERLQPGEVEESGAGWYTVVGVVGDVRDMRPEKEPEELIYYPMVGVGDDRWAAREMTLVVRTAGEPLALAEAIRSEVWSLDPGLPISQVRTMEEVVARHAVRPRFTMLLLLLAAGMTLVLGAVGLYGVISYVVSQRTQEIGVRMALGADRGAVSRMVVGQGVAVAGLGILLGLAGALAATRLLAALLYGVRSTDPVTYLTVAVFLAGVTTLASFLPARRAAAVEPVEALRWE